MLSLNVWAVRDQILPDLPSSESDHRLLLHAVSLFNVQRFTSAAHHAETYLNTAANRSRPIFEAKALNLLSSCYHNLSKYKRSKVAARQALNVARMNGFAHEAVHALANSDEALRMQLDLDLLLNARPFIGRLKLLLLTVRFFSIALDLKHGTGRLAARLTLQIKTSQV